MAFFKLGKKKKEDLLDTQLLPQQEISQVSSSPVEQVLMMKQQGYTSNQITQILQSQGYNAEQISEAISHAGLSSGFQAGREPRERQEQAEFGMPAYAHAQDVQDTQAMQSYEQPAYQQQQQSPQSFQSFRQGKEMQEPPSIDEERIQEVAEAIIDEKWEELAKDIRKVAEWKEKSEERISKLEQQALDLKMSIDSLTKSIMSKISSYDQNIVDVGTEIKAMEKVFQKVLPNLTESVNKLDRMTKGVKEPQQKK